MPFQLNTPIPIDHNENSTQYLISPKHRGHPSHDISVWSIDFDDEVKCFTNCYSNGWHNHSNGWSFIPAGPGQLLMLGRNLRSPELQIAKFVENQNQWHGYPADIRNKPGDKPLPHILINWLHDGHISKSIMTRIKQGQL